MTFKIVENVVYANHRLTFSIKDWARLGAAARRHYGIKSKKQRIMKKYITKLIYESLYAKIAELKGAVC